MTEKQTEKPANGTATEKPAKKMKVVDSTFAEGWKPAIGEVLSGVYLGSQRIEKGKRGAFMTYHFKTDAGERVSVSGASLETVMSQIPRKTHLVITYTGEKPTDKGNMKLFEVQIPEDTVLLDPFDNDDE